jgi:hypothetical protein
MNVSRMQVIAWVRTTSRQGQRGFWYWLTKMFGEG